MGKIARAIERFVLFVFAAFLLAYVGFQVNRTLRNPYTTEVAMNYSTADSVDVTGVIVREESVLPDRISGVMSYLQDDGSKVTGESVIGEVYASERDVQLQRQIRALDREIANLELAAGSASSEYANADALSRQINASLSGLVNLSASGLVENPDEDISQLTLLLNRSQVAIGSVVDFAPRLETLKNRRAELSSQLSGKYQQYYSPVTGYFVRTVDGYEERLSPQTVADMTVEELRGLSMEKISSSSDRVGKIILTHNWQYVALVPIEEMDKFRVGDRVSLNFNLFGLSDIPFQVEEIRSDDSAKDVCAVVLSGNYVLPELSSARNPSATVVFRSYSGLRVPASAKRYEGQTPGVYVIENEFVRFRTINIVYENEDYILCGANTDEERPLKLFDQVIVEGTDLYDGKPVK